MGKTRDAPRPSPRPVKQPVAAPRPPRPDKAGPEDGWPIGRRVPHRTILRGTRDAARPPDLFLNCAGLPASRGRGEAFFRPLPFWRHGSSRRHRPRIGGPRCSPARHPVRGEAPRPRPAPAVSSAPDLVVGPAPVVPGRSPETAYGPIPRRRCVARSARGDGDRATDAGTAPPPHEPPRPVTEDAPPVDSGGERVRL